MGVCLDKDKEIPADPKFLAPVPQPEQKIAEATQEQKLEIEIEDNNEHLETEIDAQSTDSDIITEPQIPKPLKPSIITVVDSEIEEILNKEFDQIMLVNRDKIKIEKDIIKNLMDHNNDQDSRDLVEQFLCVVCDNLVVPDFILGKEGIKRESIKIPQCENCHQLSCYDCFKKLLQKEKPECPKCYYQINVPQKQAIEDSQTINNDKKSVLTNKEGQNEIVNDQNYDLTNYMTFCSQKKLLHILYSIKIHHKCQTREDEANQKAHSIWDLCYQEIHERMEETGEKPFELINELSEKLSPYFHNDLRKQLQQSNSEKILTEYYEGGQDDLQIKKAVTPQSQRYVSSNKENQDDQESIQFDKYTEIEEEEKKDENQQKSIQQEEKSIYDDDQDQKPLQNSNQLNEQQDEDEDEDEKFELEKQNSKAASQTNIVDDQSEEVNIDTNHDTPMQQPNFNALRDLNDNQDSISVAFETVKTNNRNDQKHYEIQTSEAMSQSSQLKQKNSLNNFVKNIVANEQSYQRFKQIEQAEQEKIKELMAIEMNIRNQDQNILSQTMQSNFDISQTNEQIIQHNIALENEMKSQNINERRINIDSQYDVQDILESQNNQINEDNMNQVTYQEIIVRQQTNKSSKNHYSQLKHVEQEIEEEQNNEEADLQQLQQNQQEQFEEFKKNMLVKLFEICLNTEFKYLDYLNHIVTECLQGNIAETCCPFKKCKQKGELVKLNGLRKHLVNVCTKITMQCQHCLETFRRPWSVYHDCRRFYIKKIETLNEKLNGYMDAFRSKEDQLREKEELVAQLLAEKELDQQKKEREKLLKETFNYKLIEGSQNSQMARHETQSNFERTFFDNKSMMLPDFNKSTSVAMHSRYLFDGQKVIKKESIVYHNQQENNNFDKFRDIEMLTQDSFNKLNQVTMKSVGVGQSFYTKHSVAIGNSYAEEPSLYSKAVGNSIINDNRQMLGSAFSKRNSVHEQIRDGALFSRHSKMQHQQTEKIHFSGGEGVHTDHQQTKGQNLHFRRGSQAQPINKQQNLLAVNQVDMGNIPQNSIKKQNNNFINIQDLDSNSMHDANRITKTNMQIQKELNQVQNTQGSVQGNRKISSAVIRERLNQTQQNNNLMENSNIKNQQSILSQAGLNTVQPSFQRSNLKSQTPQKKQSQGLLQNNTATAEKFTWDIKSEVKITDLQQQSILENLKILKNVEEELSKADKYVEFCVQKYQPFKFNIQLFLSDELIKDTKFVENYDVNSGQFSGSTYWGQLLPQTTKKFVPHGFGLLIDKKNKVLQIGTFKNGQEHGQQRTIQSQPQNERYFTQFTSIYGKLNGPALIERADQRIEIGSYKDEKQNGVWRYRYNDGRIETVQFNMGTIVPKK